MAIGTPVQLGAAASSGTSTTVITTSGAITAGDLAVVLVEESSSITVSGVADSAGNTYTAGTAIVSGTRLIQPFYKPNAAAMSSGGTITVTRSASTGVGYAAAISVSGMDTSSPIDIQTAGSVGTATGYTLATGTLGQADELLVCFTYLSSGSGDTYVQPSGFTANTAASDGTNVLRSGYLIVSSTTTTSPHPTWGVSRTYLGQVISFKASTGGTNTFAPGAGSLSLSGKQPALTAAATLTPGAGSFALSGKIPTLLNNLLPGAGSFALTGLAPTISAAQTLAPGAGSFALTGRTPVLSQAAMLAPGAGVLAFTGAVPVLTQAGILAPIAGSLTFTGLAPALVTGSVLSPGAGSLVLTGYAPSIGGASSYAPGAGHLTFIGYAPAWLQTRPVDPARIIKLPGSLTPDRARVVTAAPASVRIATVAARRRLASPQE